MNDLTWLLLFIFSVIQVFISKWTIAKFSWSITALFILILLVIKRKKKNQKIIDQTKEKE